MFSTTSVLEPTSANPGQSPLGSGQVIAGIRERAQAFGGAIDAEQRAEGRFRVCALLPIGGQS